MSDPFQPHSTRSNPTFSSSEAQSSRGRFGRPRDPGPAGNDPRAARVALVLIGILVVLVALVFTVKALTGGGDPQSVEEVADAAVEAAEDFDVDAGIDLFCEPLTADQRDRIDDFIAAGRDAAGVDDPEVHYSVGKVEGDEEGSFQVTGWSTEGDLDGSYVVAEGEVSRDGDRSCVSDIDLEEREGDPLAQ